MKKNLLTLAVICILAFHASSQVTQIWTDYQGFWTSSSSSINSTKPDNSHNLLAFKKGATIFSTGVDDAKLISNGVSFTAKKFRAFPISSVPLSGSQYYAALGQMYDGISGGGATPFTGNSVTALSGFLTDGVNGLNIGTGLANIPGGSVLEFSLSANGITPSAIGDGIPDILFVQIATPSAGGDKLKFVNSSNQTVGTEYLFDLTNSTNFPAVANWTADFYNPSGSIALTSTDRPIAVLAVDLSDLGINATNYTDAVKLVYTTGGTADPAFVAFNEPSVSIATYLAVTSQPSLYTSTVTLPSNITVEVRDGSGLVVPQANIPIVASIFNGNGVLTGTRTRLTNSSGVATFNDLNLTGSGDQVIQFSSASLTPVTAAAITNGAVGGTASNNQVIATGGTPSSINLTSYSGTIQWQSAPSATGSWTDISGATGATLTGAQMGSLSGTTFYRAVLTKASTTAFSNVVSVETGTVSSTQYTENTTQFHIETFTGPGSFTVPSGVTDIDYLVVAGGGGGGKGSNRTGGGGSGGEVVAGSLAVSPGQVLPVVIGAGGWGGTSTSPAGDGLSSSFNSITAQGGGRGGQAATTPGVNAYGGGNNPGQNGAKGNINFMGGNGFDQGFSSGSFAGGGGGGATAAGKDGSSSKAGDGGAGISNSYQTGVAQYYAGGGAGGFQKGTGGSAPTPANQGAGGTGGGGNGGWTQESWTSGGSPSGASGTTNTGGGGGGAALDARTTVISGGAGGSGIVILRYTVQSTLPLAWGSFTAAPEGKNIRLQWTTLQEQQTKSFSLEHSNDGVNWQAVYTVAAAGNSQQPVSYNYVHLQPGAGSHYYRVVETDLNGRINNSAIRIVQLDAQENSFSIYPNPATGGKFQVATASSTKIEIFDSKGVRIFEQWMPAGVHSVDIGRVAAGIYLVKANSNALKLLIQ